MQLFDYQKKGVEFIKDVKHAYIAFDMGMGKTITSLAGSMEAGEKHILLVAEKNEIVNSENFRKEVERYFHDMDYVSLRDTDMEVVRNADSRMVCGINPDALGKINEEDLDMFDALVMDEATLAKTVSSQRFKAVRRIAEEMEVVVLLSGTPMMNGAAEIFSPLLLLNHWLGGDGSKKCQMAFEKIFAGGFYKLIKKLPPGWEYADLYGKHARERWKYLQWWAKGANHVRELRYMIESNFMFKQKGETGVFKKKDRTIKRIEKSEAWKAEYQKAWDDYLEKVKEHNKRAPSKDIKSIKNITELKRLIENGQVYQVNSKWKARQAVKDIKDGVYGDKRIIIFSMFIETDRIIQEELERSGISYKTFDDLKEWKYSGEQVLVGRIKSHAKGGNAAEACVTIMVDMDFVPTMNVQAENRMDRPEQENEMLVVYYLAEGKGDIDEHVQGINKDKMRKVAEFMRPFTKEELEEMPERVEALRAKYWKEFQDLERGYEKVRKVTNRRELLAL